jgi:hypothetical protein
MVISIRPAAAAAALVLLIAACGGSGDAQPTESTSTDNTAAAAADLPDPCALVAQDDVDAVFGGSSPTAVAGDVSGPGDSVGGRSCSWSAGTSSLWVSVFVKASFLAPTGICDYCSPIEDLGNEAWGGETDKGSGGALLAVSIDGSGVQVEAIGLDATVDQLVPLAEGVISGLS